MLSGFPLGLFVLPNHDIEALVALGWSWLSGFWWNQVDLPMSLLTIIFFRPWLSGLLIGVLPANSDSTILLYPSVAELRAFLIQNGVKTPSSEVFGIFTQDFVYC